MTYDQSFFNQMLTDYLPEHRVSALFYAYYILLNVTSGFSHDNALLVGRAEETSLGVTTTACLDSRVS